MRGKNPTNNVCKYLPILPPTSKVGKVFKKHVDMAPGDMV